MSKILIYHEWWDALKDLTYEDKGRMLEAIYKYSLTDEIELTGYLLVVFTFLKNRLDADKIAYQETCEKNRDNINRRWRGQSIPNDTTVYDRIPNDTTGYDSIPLDTKNTKSKSKSNSKSKLLSGYSVACGGLSISARQGLGQGLATTLLEIWPAADIPKQVDKCFAYYLNKGLPVRDAADTLKAWFLNGRGFVGDYKAGLSPPQSPEDRVAEYKALKGPAFTAKYGREKAAEVRDRKENFMMFGFYITKPKDERSIDSTVSVELSTQG